MTDEISIYEIYVFNKPVTVDNWGRPQIGNYHSVGFYYELETAQKAVKENWTDMNEKGTYQAAMIVKKAPGLYPLAIIQGYYIFNNMTEKYDNVETPKELENYNLG